MLRAELIHQKSFIDEKIMQIERDKVARGLGPNINKYALWALQIGNRHWLIYYLMINLISLTFAAHTYLLHIHNDSENLINGRLIVISVSFAPADSVFYL